MLGEKPIYIVNITKYALSMRALLHYAYAQQNFQIMTIKNMYIIYHIWLWLMIG